MTYEEFLNLKCFAAGNTNTVFLAVKKIFFIMNKSYKIRIRF